MIGWLLALGLLAGDNPGARDAYDFCAAKIEQAYALVVDADQTVAVEAPALGEADLAEIEALYAQASTAARSVLGDAIDAFRAELQVTRPAPEPAEPLALGALYASATTSVQRAVADALKGYRAAPRARPSAPKEIAIGDPLKPVITEASNRFDLPELWIRAVMRVESNGDAMATSPKGAMGLMQVMPATYAGLSDRYGLGDDGYELRNNVLAGSAYLREMYDRYGAAGFLAAYNAGPGRYEDSFCRRCTLPEETQRYVASVRLALGEVLFSEPKSSFYEPLSVSPEGALLLKRTGKPVPVAERLALHSLVERAVRRAASATK